MSPIYKSFSDSPSNQEELAKKSNKKKTKIQKLGEESNELEKSLRPKSLEDYIGQSRLKKILKIAIGSALSRNNPSSFGHLLLYGSPGLGKTSCALLIAELLKQKAHIFSAPSIEKPKDIIGVLMSLQTGNLLFIDEIHRLNKITEELLYSAMEDFSIELSTGKGNLARINRVSIKPFVLVGATTKLGNLSGALRNRFTRICKIEKYQEAELDLIIQRSAKLLDFALEKKGSLEIAKRSRGIPRIANQLCRIVRDYAFYKQKPADLQLVKESLNLFEIDQLGLESIDRFLLRTIYEKYNRGPVGLETLAVSLNEDPKTIEEHYEPFLIQLGFLERTPRGRKITERATNYLGLN